MLARYENRGISSAGYYPAYVEHRYHVLYFSALDSITQCISDRLDQLCYQIYSKLKVMLHQIYSKLKVILLKGSAESLYSDELVAVLELYAGDFEEHLLRSQLLTLNSNAAPSFVDFVKIHQQSFTEVVKVLVLVLVAPATNATSERSFSGLCLVKTHLRSMMGQAHLNHLLILHTHKTICY